jgi:hypothetical protein
MATRYRAIPSNFDSIAALLRGAVHRPSTHAPVTAFFVAADGTVWLQREDKGAQRIWDILDASGHLATRVFGPSSVRLVEAMGTHVWGLVDAADRPQLVMFRVVSARSSLHVSAPRER